jgi:hypothetical protein
MTEADWLACTDPQPMLEFLRDKASDRKLRLFAVACCWRHRQRVRDWVGYRDSVEATERFADGIISHLDWNDARRTLIGYTIDNRLVCSDAQSWKDALEMATDCDYFDPSFELDPPAEDSTDFRIRRWKAVVQHERRCRSDMLRDIFGNPFRPASIDSAHRTPPVIQLASAIYDQRAFDRLPELAIALEQAGCHDPGILEHCRSGCEHVRGCWLLDLVLRKS